MKSIAECLTDYVIQKGVVKKEEEEVYQYGFQATLETTLFIITCAIIASALGMIMEGMLFFIIFIPLRSYAGGLHLNHYWSCFFLSCLTFSAILLICKFVYIRDEIVFATLLVFEASIWFMYPVENINRDVDLEEDVHFRKKLKRFMLVDLLIAVVCMIAKKETYLLLVVVTFLMVVITMAIGKYKNLLQNRKIVP